MKLNITKYGLEIVPEDEQNDERDIAYIENVLGLKYDGDSIKLIRKNIMDTSGINRLETEPKGA